MPSHVCTIALPGMITEITTGFAHLEVQIIDMTDN